MDFGMKIWDMYCDWLERNYPTKSFKELRVMADKKIDYKDFIYNISKEIKHMKGLTKNRKRMNIFEAIEFLKEDLGFEVIHLHNVQYEVKDKDTNSDIDFYVTSDKELIDYAEAERENYFMSEE